MNPWCILKDTTSLAGPFGSMPQGPWLPGAGTTPDCVIQLNWGEVGTHASYKITRTWENFNNRETKIIFLSDKSWWTTNNFKSFANAGKSLTGNNLGLCKHPQHMFSCENIAKFLRKTFYIENLWWLLDWNLILVTQILTKVKKSSFLIW